MCHQHIGSYTQKSTGMKEMKETTIILEKKKLRVQGIPVHDKIRQISYNFFKKKFTKYSINSPPSIECSFLLESVCRRE